MAKKKAHALVVPLPFQGHINPLLQLSKKLLSAGFMVTFANTQANHQRIVKYLNQAQLNNNSEYHSGDNLASCKENPDNARGIEGNYGDGDEVLAAEGDLEFLLLRKSVVESQIDGCGDGVLHLLLRETSQESTREATGGYLRLVSLEEGLPASFENPALVLEASISPAVKASVDALASRLLQDEHPISCLVSDTRLVFMQDIANKYGLPRLSFWTQSAANFISNLLLAKGFQPPPDDSTLITNIPGVPPHKRSEVSVLFFDNVRFPFLTDEYLWQPFLRISEPEWVAINTYEQLEATTMDALEEILGFRPLTFGPLVGAPTFSILDGISGSTNGHREYYMKWLQDHSPGSVLYIAFGTVATMSKEQLEELVIGLEASQQPLFWVFRPDLCANFGSFRVETLLERLKNQAMVVPWAPQWNILSHPSIGGFLTHCGWNSTLEGLKAGVPMLGWPQFADQFLNQKGIEDQWEIGLGLKVDDQSRGLVSRAEVEKKVRNLMCGESGRLLREKARAFSGAAKDALADGGSSSLNFEIFLQGHNQNALVRRCNNGNVLQIPR